MALSSHELQLILSAKDNMSGPVGAVQRALGGLGSVARTAGGVLVGSLGAAAVRGVVSGIGNMAGAAFEAVAGYERLGMSLQTLAAREIREASAVTEVIGTTQTRIALTEEERQKVENLRIAIAEKNTDIQVASERLAEATAKGKDSQAELDNRRQSIEAMQRSVAGYSATLATLEAKDGRVVTSTQTATRETITQGEAMEQAGERAKELLHWIEQVGIKSPFSSEGVADAFRTAMAYGFASDEAQRMTQATIDFAAGSGGTSASMNQIALALGQIKAKGNLAGQEVLQLVNAGINVNSVLAKAFGVTTEQIVEMREKGLIPADKAIEAIVSSLEQDFGGAAERQSTSLAGLTESLQEIKTISLRNLFTGVFEAAQPAIASITDKLSSPEFQQAVTRIGAGLGQIATGFMEKAPVLLQGIQRYAGFAFDQLESFTLLPRPLRVVIGAFSELVSGERDLSSFARIAGAAFSQLGEKVGTVWADVKEVFQGEPLEAGAFTDLLTYLGMDERMADRVSAVLASVTNKVGAFITGVGQLFRGETPEAFRDLGLSWHDIFNLEIMRKEIGKVTDELGESFGLLFSGDPQGALDNLLEDIDWAKIGETLIGGIGAGVDAAIGGLADVLDTIAAWFAGDEAIGALRGIGQALAAYVIGGIDALFGDPEVGSSTMNGLANNLGRAASDLASIYWSIGTGIATGLIQGIIDRIAGGNAELRAAMTSTLMGTSGAQRTPGGMLVAPVPGAPQIGTWPGVVPAVEESQRTGALPVTPAQIAAGMEEQGAGLAPLNEAAKRWGEISADMATWTKPADDWLASVAARISEFFTFDVAEAYSKITPPELAPIPVPALDPATLDEMTAVLGEVQNMPIYGAASNYALVDRSLVNRPGTAAPPEERAAPPRTRGTGGIGGYASGTPSARGGWSMVGERGPELVRLPAASQIFNTQQTRQMVAGSTTGQTTNVTIAAGAVVVQAPRGTFDEARRGAELGILSGLRQVGVAFNG